MTEQEIHESNEITPQRKTWEKPEITEVSISDVTSSIFATGGNDGTVGFSNIS